MLTRVDKDRNAPRVQDWLKRGSLDELRARPNDRQYALSIASDETFQWTGQCQSQGGGAFGFTSCQFADGLNWKP